jgi:CRP-like cAMP-binding protein
VGVASGTVVGVRRPLMEAAIYKLSRLRDLSEEDTVFVRQAAKVSDRFYPGADLCREGERPPARVIVSGWAARARVLPDGRRQIFAFLLPGDMIGVQPQPTITSAVTALTHVETADISLLRDAASALGPRSPLAEAFALAAEMEENLLLNHIVRLGRQTACQRLAHLLLELGERLAAVHEADECHFRLPLTQENLADALGLSLVHMNRTIQQLRHEQLLRLRCGQVTLLQMDRLHALADFSPRQLWRPTAAVTSEARSWEDRSPRRDPSFAASRPY